MVSHQFFREWQGFLAQNLGAREEKEEKSKLEERRQQLGGAACWKEVLEEVWLGISYNYDTEFSQFQLDNVVFSRNLVASQVQKFLIFFPPIKRIILQKNKQSP